MPLSKRCSTCQLTKKLDQFYRSKREVLGVEYQCKKCASARQSKQREQNWRKILAHYGGKCFCCGEANEEFLTVDHLKGGGTEHRRKLNSGRLYAFVVREKFPKKFRIACMNCNFALGVYGFCPHHPKEGV